MPPKQQRKRRSKEDSFEFPTIKSLNTQGKSASASSITVYKSYMNKFADRGFKTVQSILDSPSAVLEVLKDLFPTDPERKLALFAIFYVLRDTEFNKTPNVLFWYLQTLKRAGDKTIKEDISYYFED